MDQNIKNKAFKLPISHNQSSDPIENSKTITSNKYQPSYNPNPNSIRCKLNKQKKSILQPSRFQQHNILYIKITK
jgi:hypothetical protein